MKPRGYGSPVGIGNIAHAGIAVDDVQHVHVLEVAPLDAVAIHLADTVGRQVGHLDAQQVVALTQQSADIERERRTPHTACIFAVDIDAGTLAHVAQVETESAVAHSKDLGREAEGGLVDARAHSLCRLGVERLPRGGLVQRESTQLCRPGIFGEAQRPRRIHDDALRLGDRLILNGHRHHIVVGLQDNRLARLQCYPHPSVLDRCLAHAARHGVEEYGTPEVHSQRHAPLDIVLREVGDEVVVARSVLAAQHAQA